MQHELFGHRRFLAQMSVGSMAHKPLMTAIELLGIQVALVARKALSA